MIFLFLTKAFTMKKLIAFIALAAFISACSQYTCPTYAKKEAPKRTSSAQKI
jgi:PBP1b-binding outer membrane lipoprotein LpoB